MPARKCSHSSNLAECGRIRPDNRPPTPSQRDHPRSVSLGTHEDRSVAGTAVVLEVHRPTGQHRAPGGASRPGRCDSRSPRSGGGAVCGPLRSGPARRPGGRLARQRHGCLPLHRPRDGRVRPRRRRPGRARARARRRAAGSAGRAQSSGPPQRLAASVPRVCSRRAFVAHTDDSGHTVSRPESGSKPMVVTCPAGSGRGPPLATAERRQRPDVPGPAGDQHTERGPAARPGPVAPGHLAAAHACPHQV